MRTFFVKLVFVPLAVLLVIAGTVILWLLRKVVSGGRKLTGCQITEGQAWIDSIWNKWNFVWEQYAQHRRNNS